MKLREYQRQAIDRVLAGWQEFDKQLLVCPTGSGKTIIFAHLASHFIKQNKKVLILCHREELIEQAIDKIYKAVGIVADKEEAEAKASTQSSLVVASVQTLMRDNRLNFWNSNHFDLIVCDEAHHAISRSWQKVLKHFSNAKVLGVTATPDRGDNKNLGVYFENIAYEISLLDLIKQGYLAPITVKSIPIQINISNVKSVAGDFDDNELDSALTPYLPQIARAIKEHASFRKTLVFLPLIATSKRFVDICNSIGLSAKHIDGESKDRHQLIKDFKRWDFDVLCNAMLLTEGYDEPDIDCIAILRPTRSRPLYAQMVGRGTRVSDTKENLLLLDFLWLHEKHKIVKPANLIATTEKQADEITELIQNKSKNGVQPSLDLRQVMTEAQVQREQRLAEELRINQKRSSKFISADEFAVLMHDTSIVDYEPAMRWENDDVTDKQKKVLLRAGIDLATVKNKGHASKIIDLIFKNQKLVLASPKQRALMKRFGYPNADLATVQEAKMFFANFNKAKGAPV